MFSRRSWAKLRNSFSPVIVCLLLVWIAPTATVAEGPISHNDPFRAIAMQKPKPTDPPICCLKPLTPLEPVEDDLLLSFEEWKARQHDQNSENSSSAHSTNANGSGAINNSDPLNLEDTMPPAPAQEDQQLHVPPQAQEILQQLSPHFRVPLVDRFNYASLECSARVHTAHKSAKHPSNILSSKKDRYMLSPCKTKGEKQFVVIELCEDIRIDTVQLANFEFFSGVFKDFTVSVAKTYSVDEEGWTIAGNYKAKNVRGVQSFHPPTSLRHFYRYLRIDFHSHYGSEYYCPVSLVRVYGLTHLEEWKWELWETESRAKVEAALKDAQLPRTTEILSNTNATNDSTSVNLTEQTARGESSPPSTQVPSMDEIAKDEDLSTTMAAQTHIHSTDAYLPFPSILTDPPEGEKHVPPSSTGVASAVSGSLASPVTSTTHTTTHPSTTIPTPVAIISNTSTSATASILTRTASVVLNSSSSRSSILLIPTPLTPSPLPPAPISGGESIYRMIMNRLTALETNHTLFGKYMAQQQAIVREALKRLNEDIGRLDGLGKSQRQVHDRTVLEWEKQRKQWQMEHAQLMQRIEYLSEEIIMEKRLGVAQLCLLLAVLVFMGLTRGSRGPVMEDRRHWRTTLGSLSGEWPILRRASQDLRFKKRGTDRVDFPKISSPDVPVRATKLESSLPPDSAEASSTPVEKTTAKAKLGTLSQQVEDDKNQRPEHGQHSSIHSSMSSHDQTRSISRSGSRTLFSTGRSIMPQSGASSSRPAVLVEMRNGYNGGTEPGTPSKGPRIAGIYTPNRSLGHSSLRGSAPVYRRPAPLQRSHSSHGSPAAVEYVLGKPWTGSGSAPKSARKWARTAHMHEVRGTQKENRVHQSGLEKDVKVVGRGSGDVFDDGEFSSRNDLPRRSEDRGRDSILVLQDENVETEADADGWESASDVDLDDLEEM